MPLNFHHMSVLLQECINGLAIRPDGVYVDGTAGGAGHSKEIARWLTNGRLIAIDKDEAAVNTARERLKEFGCAQVVQGDFIRLDEILDSLCIAKVDGILLDLGVSSYQLDVPERGFSYHNDAPLDMRMSGTGLSAYDVVNTYSAEKLTELLRDYGEEKFAYRIARNIETIRQQKPVATTFELVDIIKASIPAAARREGGHPAKRAFQAIRIEVNGELAALERCLEVGFERLSQGGRFAIITFHSLEDRMVKKAFVNWCRGCTCPPDFPICTCGKTPRAKLVNKKPVTAGPEELEINNRSRSAKLRVAEKII